MAAGILALAGWACGADAPASVPDADGAIGDVAPDAPGGSDGHLGEDVAPDTADLPDADAASEVGDDVTEPGGPWRSLLYPEGWSPGYEPLPGHLLHDFSYAGYRGGGVPLGRDGPTAIVDVVADHGADPEGGTDASATVAAAVAAASAAGGGVVYFPPGLYRLDDVVLITDSRVVLRGAGPEASRLYFTRSAGMGHRSHITFRGVTGGGASLPLASDAPALAREVEVEDAEGLAVGDDVSLGWLISEPFVSEHGMDAHWGPFNGQWQPFFRRTVTAIDTASSPHRVALDVPLRYPALVRDGASLRVEPGVLREVGVESLGLANAVAWDDAWAQSQVHVLELDGVSDAWVRDVASFPSPGAPVAGPGAGRHLQSGGIMVRNAKRVTVADTHLAWPQHRGTGGNGYLFEVRASSEILYRDCSARGGRHNFIQNWGFGATGIVWLRVHSAEGRAEISPGGLGSQGDSEFHHSLAMANLIDASVIDDGWSAINRKDMSSGAGHTATESVFWNVSGTGRIRSYQFGLGYVIGPGPDVTLQVIPEPPPEGLEEIWESLAPWEGAAPDDWLEGVGRGADLVPSSLYEDQLARRLGGR